MSVITETVAIKDEISGPAKAAAGELNALSRALTVAQDKMTIASALGNVKAFRSASQDVANLKAAISTLPPANDSAASSVGAVSKALDTAGPAAGGLAHAFAGAADAVRVGKEVIGAAIEGMKAAITSLAAGDVKGAIEGVTDTVAGLAKALDLVVPGLGEVVSAVVNIAGGVVGVTAGLVQEGAKLAIEATTSKNAMLSMFDALGEGAISGEKVDDMLDGLRSKLGATKDSMVPIVKEFMSMGVTSQDALERMTTAALSAKALTGGSDAAAQAFTKLAGKIQVAAETGQALKIPLKGLGSLASMGLTVEDVAKQMGVSSATLAAQLKSGSVNAAKFGDALQSALIDKGAGPLKTMTASWENLKSTFHEYIGDLFEDLKEPVGAFLVQVKDLFSVFESKTNPSGKALKEGVEGTFKRIFEAATKVVPMVKHFLLFTILYSLKAWNALKPIRTAIAGIADQLSGGAGSFFGDIVKAVVEVWPKVKSLATTVIDLGAALLSNQTFVNAMGNALKLVAVAIGAVIVVAGAAVAGIGILMAEFAALGVATYAVVGAIVGFVNDTSLALGNWVISAVEGAKNFIAGLVQGIAGGAGQVVDAVKDVAKGAVDTFTGFFKMRSPSKLMADLGGLTTEGFATGLTEGVGQVKASSLSVAKAAAAPMAAVNSVSLNAGLPDAPRVDVSSGLVPPAPTPDAQPAAASGGGKTITINVGGIHIDGAGKGAEELTEEAVSIVFERIARESGI